MSKKTIKKIFAVSCAASAVFLVITLFMGRFFISGVTAADDSGTMSVNPTVTQIVRPATQAVILPARPQITIPLFPDADKWYSVTTGFIAEWLLPADITDVATSIDKVPSSEPPRSEGLFDSKIFSPLSDGIWYLHIQFKNNKGWGPVAHRKISVDSMPPEAFDMEFSHGLSSDNPSPTVTYGTNDQLSGIKEYVLTIGSDDPISTSEPSATLPMQGPGKHILRVAAFDGAGNSAENVVEFEITPINPPFITEVSERAYIDEGVVDVRGFSFKRGGVMVTLRDKIGQVVAQTTTNVDEDGNWMARLDGSLRRGVHSVTAIVRDERGALSYSSSSRKVTVTERPLFTVGSFEVTPTWFYIGTIIILIVSFFLGLFSERAAHAQRGRKIMIATRDVSNAFGTVKKDIGKVLKSKDIPEEAVFRLKKVIEGIEKVEGYVSLRSGGNRQEKR